MKANIQTYNSGLREIDTLKTPFQVNNIWLFVHKDKGYFVVTEWQTGIRFTGAYYKEKIRPSINNVFEKIPLKRIKEVIQENIEKYGIANEGIPKEGNQ